MLRPDWMDHVGNLTLVLLVPGGNQEVFRFMTETNRVQQVLGGTDFKDEHENPVVLDRNLVVVSPVSTGWDDLDAGDGSNPIGQTAYLFDLDDVDWVERMVAIVTRLIASRYGVLMRRPVPGAVFLRRFIAGFSGGGGLTFRVISERPWLFDGAAVAGTNCAGWENAFMAGEVPDTPHPGWRSGPSGEPHKLHVQIGLDDELVWHFGLVDADTPPLRKTLPDQYVDPPPAVAPPGFSSVNPALEYGPAAYYPLQVAYDAPGGVADWFTSDGSASPTKTLDPGVDVQDNDTSTVRLVQVPGLGHDLPKFVPGGGYDWLPSVLAWLSA
jgi:hypothetical protein